MRNSTGHAEVEEFKVSYKKTIEEKLGDRLSKLKRRSPKRRGFSKALQEMKQLLGALDD